MMTRTLNDTVALAPRAVAAAVLAALGVLGSGCGSDSSVKAPGAPSAACTGGELEADLQAEPLAGAGVDPDTGELRPPPEGTSYTVSATYGIPRPGDAVMERYRQYFGAIQADLASRPGLVAMQLAQSPSCGSGRTLAVWASTDAMYGFVMGPAHLAAVDAVNELVEPSYAVTHWETARLDEMTMEEGVRRIKADGAPAR